ncbi:MAG: hypothetical protein JW943_17395 [Deltaproteobacteria bacterium]|nr:hypothetical protein [Deltaproteobacteria bacterium]
MAPEEFEEARKTLTPLEVRRKITERSMQKNAMTEEAFIKMLDEAGVACACIGTGRHASIEHTAALAARHKDRLIPLERKANMGNGKDGVIICSHCGWKRYPEDEELEYVPPSKCPMCRRLYDLGPTKDDHGGELEWGTPRSEFDKRRR